MIRSLQNEKGILRSFVDNQWRLVKHEEIGYRAAYLARLRQKIVDYTENYDQLPTEEKMDQLQDKLYDEVNLLSTDEHWELAKADQLEQIFKILSSMHKVARKSDLVLNKRYEELSEMTAIIDPDKFPIFNLIDKSSQNDFVSVWDYKKEMRAELQKELGYMLEIKESKIEHHEAGKGVFLNLEDKDDVIVKGSLLAFIPGVIYNAFEKPTHESLYVEKNFITRYDETTVKFDAKIPYPFKLGYSVEDHLNMKADASGGHNSEERIITSVPGEYVNPYAYGHMINHPPPDIAPNVLLVDLIIPHTFFPHHIMRYLPNILMSAHQSGRFTKEYFHEDCIHGLGVVALENLKHGDELYTDYFESRLYSLDYTPDWLKRPPPISPYLKKYEFENKYTFFVELINMFLLSQKGSAIDEYLEKTSHDGNRGYKPLSDEKLITKKLNANKQNNKNS